MSRQRSSKNDWRRLRKFEVENEKLRKEINKLRKVVSNLVTDQLERKAQKIEDGEPIYTPVCDICGNEDLGSISIKRPDGEWEIKLCRSCGHRHQMKTLK